MASVVRHKPRLSLYKQKYGKASGGQFVNTLVQSGFKQKRRVSQRTKAMTLVELLLVLAIVGIVLALGANTLRSDGIAVGQAATATVGVLRATRFEAIRRNSAVGIEFRVTDNLWRRFEDRNGDRIFSSGDLEIERFEISNRFPQVKIKSATVGGNPATVYNVVFDSRGFVRSTLAGKLVLTNLAGDSTKAIEFNLQGRARVL